MKGKIIFLRNNTVFFNFLSVMKTLLYFKNRIQTAVKPINIGLTAVFYFLNCQRWDYNINMKK